VSLFSKTKASTYKEVVQNPCWTQTMKAKIDALNSNQTWDIVVIPPNVKPIQGTTSYKMIFSN